MTKKIINIGTPNKGDGDPLRTAFDKINQNFTELYNTAGADVQIPAQSGQSGKFLTTNGTTLSWATVVQDTATVTEGETPPVSPNAGDLWYDTAGGRLYIYYDSTWVDASPVDGAGLALGNWTFDASTLTSSGTTSTIFKRLENTTTDGETTFTDATGSNLILGEGSAILEGYTDPAGVNNEARGKITLTANGVTIENTTATVGGSVGSAILVAGSGILFNTGDGVVNNTYSFSDILTLPNNNYLETTNIDLKIGAQGTVTIRSNAESNLTTREWEFDRSGTVTVPNLFPATFTATVDPAHYYGEGSLTLEGDAWHFEVTFAALSNGTVETQITNNTPWPSNPGYIDGLEFRFVEADHGIPGYTFTLTLVDIQNPGPAGWTTNLAASLAPTLPSTITSPVMY